MLKRLHGDDFGGRPGRNAGAQTAGRTWSFIIWGVVALYAALEAVRALLPDAIPLAIAAAATTLLPFVFALLHGSRSYSVRDVGVFAGICFVVSNGMENMSILTGIPFGHYYYTDVLGPKLFLVPIQIFAGYFGMGYVAWTLARAILDDFEAPRPRLRVVTLPLVAAFVMVAWDLACDPLASTVQQRWIWVDGGGYFGVPLVNFLGWYGTVYLFLQLFALYLDRWGAGAKLIEPAAGHALQAVAIYAATALYYVLALAHVRTGTVTDHAGVVWRLADIQVAAALVAIFVMGAFALLATARIVERHAGD